MSINCQDVRAAFTMAGFPERGGEHVAGEDLNTRLTEVARILQIPPPKFVNRLNKHAYCYFERAGEKVPVTIARDGEFRVVNGAIVAPPGHEYWSDGTYEAYEFVILLRDSGCYF